MANIQSIEKGYPRQSCFEMQFKPASGVTLVAGDLVKLISETEVDKVTLADGEEIPVFMVLEGNDTYSGARTKAVVVLAGHFVTTVKTYQTGSYVVNTPLTSNAGKYIPVSGTKKVIAHALAFSLANGLKVIHWGK